jgi:glycerate 2-kinase
MTLVSDALAIARAGIRAADPGRAVRREVRRGPGGLALGASSLRPGSGGRVHLVALGKAAGAMVDAAAGVLGPAALGIAITPRGYPAPRSTIPVVYGDHPVPRRASFRAGAALLRYVAALPPEDAVLFLISGGGSAVAEVPAPSLTPDDLTRTTELLLASGAPIGSMNAIRRHLSLLKGGRLAQATAARGIATVVVSDVVGDPPADIASGPTVGDPSTYADALRAVRAYHLSRRLPARVIRLLVAGARGDRPETPKPGDPRFRRTPFRLAATNRTALGAAAREARRRGFRTNLLSSRVTGETAPVARVFARRLRRAAAERPNRPVALLSGGETTVTLGRHPGRGGRNQEFALAAASELAGENALVLSVGTDGIDGPTDAAGGWTDGQSTALARRRGVDLEAALRRHAAYDALARLGGLVRTGPTGTNVMDLHLGLSRPRISPGTAGSSRRGGAPSSRRRPS